MTLGEALEEETGLQGLAPVCGGGCLQPMKEPSGQAGSERDIQLMRVWSRGEASRVSVSKVWGIRS